MNSLPPLFSRSHVGRLLPASSLSGETAPTIWILLCTPCIPLLPLSIAQRPKHHLSCEEEMTVHKTQRFMDLRLTKDDF